MGPAALGADPLEVVIGVSPGFGKELHETTAGHPLSAVVRALIAGIAEGGGRARFVRCRHTADTSFLGLTAAKLSGSGIGIGIQAKGTTVLHRSDRLPHLNLELFSNAPVTSLAHYQALARNAALHARGQRPDPVVVPSHGQALSARFHVQVALIHAVETALTEAGAPPIEVKPVFLRETVA
jgi:propanediol dehydratase large subunit